MFFPVYMQDCYILQFIVTMELWRTSWLVVGFILLVMSSGQVMSSCCKRSRTTLDCRNCGLGSLPLSVMDNSITELILLGNNITTIPDEVFVNMTALRRLELQGNPLQNLSHLTFRGLESLECLGIGNNGNFTPTTIVSEIFRPLKRLTSLKLENFYPLEVPKSVLQVLPGLQALEMIMGDTVLGDEFRDLKNLRNLSLTYPKRYGNCVLHVTNETLANVPQIRNLLFHRSVHSIHPDAFKKLPELSSLYVLLNPNLDITTVFDAIKNQIKPTLHTLVLDGSGSSNPLFLRSELFNSANFKLISKLSLKHTGIVKLDGYFLFKLPKLRSLNIGCNSIISVVEMDWKEVIPRIHNMLLESLDIKFLFAPDRRDSLCTSFSDDCFRAVPNFIVPPVRTSNDDKTNGTVLLLGDKKNRIRNLPRSLRYIFAGYTLWSSKSTTGKILVLNSDNSVLYIEGSHMQTKGLALVKGLNKLQGLDFSHNDIFEINEDQLYYLPSLKYLNLAHNNLKKINIKKLLGGGHVLQWLDLSYCNLNHIAPDSFSSLVNIKNISLGGNPLLDVFFDLHNSARLEILHLSDCSLRTLTKSFLDQLDNLQFRVNHTISLNITMNRFECSCTSIDMITWFSKASVQILDKDQITCDRKNVSVRISDIDIEELAEECQRNGIQIVHVVVIPIIVAILTFSVLFTVYRLRWRLMWTCYKFRRRLRKGFVKRSHERILQEMYTAFVAFNHTEDYEWVVNTLIPLIEDEMGFRLCFGQRDFIAGVPITENVCEAISNSHYTILVITPGFAESTWCDYEMHMALTRGIQRIIIIYKEEVPVSKMSRALRMLLQSVTYIEYKQDHVAQNLFRKKLHNALVV